MGEFCSSPSCASRYNVQFAGSGAFGDSLCSQWRDHEATLKTSPTFGSPTPRNEGVADEGIAV